MVLLLRQHQKNFRLPSGQEFNVIIDRVNELTQGYPGSNPLAPAGSFTVIETQYGQMVGVEDGETVTLPAGADSNARVDFYAKGAGGFTFAAQVGANIVSASGLLSVSTQYGAASAISLGNNQWLVVGADA